MASELERAILGSKAPKRKTYFFWGPPGSGKTELALQHKAKRRFWFDIDNKLGEVRNPERIANITVWTPGVAMVKQIEAIQVDPTRKDVYAGTKITERPEGYDRTVKATNELIALKATTDFPYDLVVLDSITTLVDHMEMLILYQHKTSLIQETLYEVIKRNLRTFVSGLLQLPCDIIVIGHSKHIDKKDRDGKTIDNRFVPMITGSYASVICKEFSEAYFFTGRMGNGKWYVQTAPSSRVESARTAKGLDFEQEILPDKIFA